MKAGEPMASPPPLETMRIVDLGTAWTAPYAVTLLSFAGAEIIKIENPKRPDLTRRLLDQVTRRPLGLNKSLYFMEANLNKLSVGVDIYQPRGQEVVKALVSRSDVVVENFRPGVVERLGLGYERLREVKPDIVMLSISAAGRGGPESQYSGYAPLFAAAAGLGYVTGYPGGPPTEVRHIADAAIGTVAAFALMAALIHRQNTGQGQHIDMSGRESLSCFIGEHFMDYAMNDRVREREGNRDSLTYMAPHNCYPCRGQDRWVSIAVGNEAEWQALCREMGDPDWCRDERFSTARHRWEHQEKLDQLIGEWTSQHDALELTQRLQAAGVAAFPAYTAQDLAGDIHLWQRGYFVPMVHPELGERVVMSAPWRMSGTPISLRRPGPLLGEHTEQVLSGLLGMPPDQLSALEKEGVLFQHRPE